MRSCPLPILLCLACLAILLGAGCRSNCDLVEAELRAKEAQLAEMQHEIDRRDFDLRGLQSELDRLQQHSPGHASETVVPCGVKRIVLGRMTGGWDADPGCPGDEGILVLLEPHDGDNQSVKAAGALHVEAYEVNSQGLKSPLSAWDVPTRELRKYWDTPVFGGPAYRVPLPWQSWPREEKLRIVALFTTSDGQRFEADRDISVRLPARPLRPTSQPKPTEELLPAPKPAPETPTGPVLPPPPGEVTPATFRDEWKPARGVGLQRPERNR